MQPSEHSSPALGTPPPSLHLPGPGFGHWHAQPRGGTPGHSHQVATSRLLFVVPVLCLENTFSPCPGQWAGRGQQKIEDIPPYCTWTLYTGPPDPGRRGSWHILGSLFGSGRGDWGGITREGEPPGGHSGPGFWSWHFLVLPQQHPPTWLSLPPPPGLRWSPWAPGNPVLPSQSGGPKGRLWLLRGSPRSPVTRGHAGEGVRVAEAAV